MNQIQKWEPGEDEPPRDEAPQDSGGDDSWDPVSEAEDPELARRSAEVRMWSTGKLQVLVESLEPYVDGSLGQVSPRHAATYLQAVKEVSRLWGSDYKPPRITPAQVRRIESKIRDQVELEAAEAERERQRAEREQREQAAVTNRARVLEQLEELRRRSG